jgi:hypothetical protein
MIRLIKLITFAVTIICTGLVLLKLYKEEKPSKKEKSSTDIIQEFVLKSNKPIFSMEVSHDEWHGKLEPGRYTKSGILIIKQNGN